MTKAATEQATTPAPRQTRQRAAVSSVMAESDPFRTAQQVHDELRRAGDAVGLTTVYRTLAAMAEAGEVDVVRTPSGELSYRRCASDDHHHHLVCRRCGTTVEVGGEGIEEWAGKIGRQHGFTEVGHDFELFGLCADCS